MNTNLQIEPKIGEIITINGIKYITQRASDAGCSECAFCNSYCWNIVCNHASRKDCKAVILKKVETNMNEVKIQIPNNCELIKDGDTYVVREKKQEPPRSWEEFCKRCPKQMGEACIDMYSNIKDVVLSLNAKRDKVADRNWCSSKEEAEAFLALMQLRQLRKAWIRDWEPIKGETYWGIYNNIAAGICDNPFAMSNTAMSFPTPEMADDFLGCFRDLCETAKILL